MDLVRSVLHKHVDKPSFRRVSTPQSRTPSSTEVRSTLHMFPIRAYTLQCTSTGVEYSLGLRPVLSVLLQVMSPAL